MKKIVTISLTKAGYYIVEDHVNDDDNLTVNAQTAGNIAKKIAMDYAEEHKQEIKKLRTVMDP